MDCVKFKPFFVALIVRGLLTRESCFQSLLAGVNQVEGHDYLYLCLRGKKYEKHFPTNEIPVSKTKT